MQFLAWLDALSAPDISAPGAASRRVALTRLGRGVLATLPAAVAIPAATAGPSPRITSVITDALNLVLRVARTQRALLAKGLADGTPPNGEARARFQMAHDYTHDLIVRVENSILLSGDALTPTYAYDFTGNSSATGGGPLNPSSYDDLLVLAQVFADLISRTLVSSLSVLVGYTVFSELFGQLLGTASRLAALVRLTRQERVSTLRPWIIDAEGTAALPDIFTTTTMPYAGEASTIIFGTLDLASMGATAVLPADPARTTSDLTAAFDQPLPLVAATATVPGETLPIAAISQLLAPFEVI